MKRNFLLIFIAAMYSVLSLADTKDIGFCSYVSYSSDNWTYPGDLGIYRFTDGKRSTVYANEKFSEQDYTPTDRCATGGVYVNGHYRYVQATTGRYGSVASTAWVDFDVASKTFSRRAIVGNASNIMANIAYTEDYDDATNSIYGYYQSSDYSSCSFGKRNVETGEVTQIVSKSVSDRLLSIAFDGKGQLWGIDYGSNLVTIDKQTGNTTTVAQVSLMGQPSGMCFDKTTGKLYLLMAQQLFEINKSTGELTKLWRLEGAYSLQGLFIAVPAAEDKAPAAVADLNVDFGSEGSLNGTVSFVAPYMTFDGTTQLSGNVDVKVSFNDDVETLSVPAGKSYTYNKTVAEAGLYSVTVAASNWVGDGPKATASLYIGEDTPGAVGDLAVKRVGGKASLSWQASTAGEHEGGYLAKDKIAYTVRRYLANGSGTVVAKNLKETTFTDAAFSPSALCGVYYEVTATTNGKDGGVATTGKVVLGPALTPAVTLIHPKESDLDLFTQICNDDNSGYWEYQDPSADRTAIYFRGHNDKGNTDNWLISPPVHMEKGKVYRVSWTACNQSTPAWYPEEMEVRVGTDATAEALLSGKVLLEPTVMKQDREDGEFVRNFIPDETGDYNIGFHDVTPQGKGYGLLVWNLSVGEGLVAGVPDIPTVMSCSSHDKGELMADIVFMAPSQTNVGDELTGDKALTAVKVVDSANKEVYSLSEVSPGGIVTAMGLPAKQGDNVYIVVAENSLGVGVPIQVSVYAGVGLPQISAAPTFSIENGNPVIRWQKSDDVSSDGKYVDVEKVDYSVMVPTSEKDWQTVVTTKNTEYVIPRSVLDMEDGNQGLLYFGIRPSNVAGKGAMKETNSLLAGKSYAAPWRESCADGVAGSYWMVDDYSMFNRSVWEANSFCSDGDGGSFKFVPCESTDESVDSCTVSFGKVDIKKLSKPALRFDTYVTPNSKAWIDVKVSTNCDAFDRKTIRKIDFGTMENEGWQTVMVDLSAYKDADNVMLAFAGHSAKVPLYIDNIRVMNYAEKNLAVSNVSAPVKVYSGDEAVIVARVSNEGEKSVGKYDVRLYDGETLLATLHGDEIAPDTAREFEFKVRPNNDGGDYVYPRVEVVSDGDEVSDDNSMSVARIRVVKAELAAPTGLVGIVVDNDKVRLSWNAPEDKSAEPKDVVDSFENLEPWSIKDFGEWTMVDADGGYTYSLSGFSWQNEGKPHAAIVFAPGEVGLDYNMPAYDGEKYLASFVGEKDCDDWIISPRLSGNAQTFSFMVSELGKDQYVSDEEFELLVSKTTADISAFEKVGDTHVVDVAEPNWKEVALDVEDGVRYVAIHHVTAGGTALLVDYAKYQMASLPFNYDFVGYNVYCDGELLNDTPLSDASFVAPLRQGKSVYSVRAVYTIGESVPSNTFDASTLGIELPSVDAESSANGETYDLQGRKVNGARSHGVYIAKGKKYAH